MAHTTLLEIIYVQETIVFLAYSHSLNEYVQLSSGARNFNFWSNFFV